MDTAYLAAATALLWLALYYLPVGSPLFQLALPLPLGGLIGAVGFLVRVAVLSVMVGENLWVVITSAAAGLLERLAGLLALGPGLDLLQVQLAALALVLFQNLLIVLCHHAVAYWIFPRLQSPISEPPPALRSLVALDPL